LKGIFVKLQEIIDYMNKTAPPELALEWDNSGLLIGRDGDDIKKILFCLDVTKDAAAEAVKTGADLIISHHPIIFKPLKNLTDPTLLTLIRNNIAVFSAHTNLDAALLNDVLFERLGLTNKEDLCEGIGKAGDLPRPSAFLEFAESVKIKLGAAPRCAGQEKTVRRAAVAGGACGGEEFIIAARKKNCDVLVTGDVKHHAALFAAELDVNVIDATHGATEVIIIDELIKRFENFGVATAAYKKEVFYCL
jgi:dinuclear metal center YbgI/SA1388 family protein